MNDLSSDSRGQTTLLLAPWSKGSIGKNDGCKDAPSMIVDALKNFFLDEFGLNKDYSITSIDVHDDQFQATHDAVAEAVRLVRKKFILLGGDHSLTFPSVKSFVSLYKDARLLIFDAHLDMESDFLPPTHEDFLRALITGGFLSPEQVLLVGVRHWHDEEDRFLKDHHVRLLSMRSIARFGLTKTIEEVLSFVGDHPLYLSLDIDAIDPAFAPGTGYPEPGGLSSREVLSVIHALKEHAHLLAADVVEVNPHRDVASLTTLLAAKLVKELLW